MKKCLIYLFTAAIITTPVFLSCSKEKNAVRGIIMTTRKSHVQFTVEYDGPRRTYINVYVDWGDGTKEKSEVWLSEEWRFRGCSFTHEYSSSSIHTITVTGGKITRLDCSDNELISLDVRSVPTLEDLTCHDNRLISLDLSKNRALKSLDCRYNRLTGLNVSEHKKLYSINLQFNHMSAEALNALFGTLHNATLSYASSKSISVSNNGPNYDGSGAANCDQSIAEARGWKVSAGYMGTIDD